MITNPTYNKPSFSCSQNWVNVFVSFETERKAAEFVKKFKTKYPKIVIGGTKVIEQTIWIDSRIDTGKRYYLLTLTFNICYIENVIWIN